MQGVRSRKEKIIEYIGRYEVNAVQGTKLAENYKFKLANFNVARRDGTFNHTPHGGVALFIHSSAAYEKRDINTPIQVMVARVRLDSTITCNIYSLGAQALDRQMREYIQ